MLFNRTVFDLPDVDASALKTGIEIHYHTVIRPAVPKYRNEIIEGVSFLGLLLHVLLGVG